MASSGARRLTTRIISWINPRAPSQKPEPVLVPAPAPAPAPTPEVAPGEKAKPRNPSSRWKRKALRRVENDILSERCPDQLVSKFVAASTLSACFRDRHRLYETAVSRLATRGRQDAVEAIIEAQKPFLHDETEAFAALLIRLYGRASMPSHAAATFRDLPPQHKSVTAFNALLAAYVNSGDFEALATAFQEIPASCPTVVPSLYSYNFLIGALCQKPDLSSALDVIQLMEKRGLSPDIISFNTLLSAFYNSVGSLDDAEIIWEMMRERNVEPDTNSYNAKLWGLVARWRIVDAAALIKLMEEDGPKPDTESYNVLIRGYRRKGMLDGAKKVYDNLVEMMEKGGPKPDTKSYNELIQGYCEEGRLDDAKKVSDDLVKNECVPNEGTFRTLVPHLVKSGELDRAVNCCHEIIRWECKVYVSLLQGVITALVDASRVEDATRIIKLGRKKNYYQKSLMMPHDVKRKAMM